MAQATVLQDQPDTLSVLVRGAKSESKPINVSFFGGIDTGRVGIPEITDDGIVYVASLDDLMATKVKVLLQRVEAKDYRDIAALMTAGTDLSRGLAAACRMYGPDFQPSESLKALVYFKGGDLHTLTKAEKRCLVQAASEVRDLPHVAILSRQLTVHPSGE